MAETVSTSKPSKKRLIFLILVVGLPCLLVALRLLGLQIPYSIPTDEMSPSASKNDMLLVEGFTFLRRQPARGDIVAFKTEFRYGPMNRIGAIQ
jgi:signal peptidase I